MEVSASEGSSAINIPEKLLKRILSSFPQSFIQKTRRVCKIWNSVILRNFPVEFEIDNNSYEKKFRCPNAAKVELNDFTTEFDDYIAFSPTVKHLTVNGQVTSSVLGDFLSQCHDIESLQFKRISQTMYVKSKIELVLPKLTSIDFQVKPSHDGFTSDELLVIDFLKTIKADNLTDIIVSCSSSIEWLRTFEDDEDDVSDFDAEPSAGYSGSSEPSITFDFTNQLFLPNPMLPQSDPVEDAGVGTESPGDIVLLNREAISDIGEHSNIPEHNPETVNLLHSTEPASVDIIDTENRPPALGDISYRISENNTERDDESTAMTVDEPTAVSSIEPGGTTAPINNTFRPSIDFAIRLFQVNIDQTASGHTEANEDNALGQVRDPFLRFTRVNESRNPALATVGTIPRSVEPKVFFEFFLNHCNSIKRLNTSVRTDFMCFGSLTPYKRVLPKIQFHHLAYSFGRTQMADEYELLKVQASLRSLKMSFLEDMWLYFKQAVRQSCGTLETIDVRILSMTEEPLNFSFFGECKSLVTLKCLFFYEKIGLQRLPVTLNKLLLNGPLTSHDMLSISTRLTNLVEYTIILNNGGDKIDLELFQTIARLPKLSNFLTVQCPMDLPAIMQYCESQRDREITIKNDDPITLGNRVVVQYCSFDFGELKN